MFHLHNKRCTLFIDNFTFLTQIYQGTKYFFIFYILFPCFFKPGSWEVYTVKKLIYHHFKTNISTDMAINLLLK